MYKDPKSSEGYFDKANFEGLKGYFIIFKEKTFL